MKCTGWESAVGQPALSLTVNTLTGTKVSGPEVEAWFRGIRGSSLSLYYKGVAYFRVTNYPEKGWECFQRALDSGLTGPQACLLKAERVVRERGSSQSIEYLMETLKACETPEEKEAINGKLGYFFYSSGKYKDAVEHYEVARNINSRLEWLNNLGCCYLKLGDVETGRRFLKRAAQLAPYNDRIQNNKLHLDLLCGGRQTLSKSIASFMSSGALDKSQKEKFISLVSLASEMGQISDEVKEEYLLLADLASGNVEKAIIGLTEKREGFKGLGEGVEAGVFSILYNYVCTDWPDRYSQGLRCAILNTCSRQTVLDGLQKNAIETEGDQCIALKFVLRAFVHDISVEQNTDILKDLTQALEHDCEGLIRIAEADSGVRNLIHQVGTSLHWAHIGIEKTDAAMCDYCRDDGFNEIDPNKSYFESPIIFYKNALLIFPQDLALLEGYADLLKAIRSISSLPEAIELYQRIIQLDSTKAQKINEKINNSQSSLKGLLESTDRKKYRDNKKRIILLTEREKKRFIEKEKERARKKRWRK